MIALWMLYCAAVGVLMALGAAAAERALAAWRLPVRFAWAAALALTLAVPLAVRLLPAEAPRPVPVAMRAAAPAAEAGVAAPAVEAARKRVDLRALDAPLLAGWAASSAVAFAALAVLAAVLDRRRRRWRAETVDGVPVLVSPDTGPAVVGLLRSRIVLPEWACAADDEVRALMLEHEREHVRAADPALLGGALLAAALMPWNPAVWWQLRRLRLAVEVDCDARVLRRRGDVRAYGTLLLEMGRRAGAGRLAVAAFSEPRSFLEKRIRTMTAPNVRFAGLRAAGFGALALALVAAACETPGPMQVAPAGADRVYAAPGAGHEAARIDPRRFLAQYYPDVLSKGVGDGATVMFVLSPEGEVLHHKLEAAPERQSGVTATVDGRRMSLRLDAVLSEKRIEPDEIATVDISRFSAGQMGPEAVSVVLVRMAQPGSRAELGAKIRIRGAGEMSEARSEAPKGTVRMRVQGSEVQIEPVARAEGEEAPVIPNGTIMEALRQRFPDARPGGEYWFVADARDEVLQSGTMADDAPLDGMDPNTVAAVQVQRMQVGGGEAKVMWIRLKATS